MFGGLNLTVILVIANVAASFYAWNNPHIYHKWMFNPNQVYERKEYFRFITSGFIHANYMHLIFNMIALWSFGSALEDFFTYYYPQTGRLLYLVLYFLALIISDVPTFWKHRHNYGYNALGASGAVSAVVFACVFLQPWSQVLILFIPMPGILMAILYLGYSYFGSRRQFGDNINHDAHLYGALFGWLFMFLVEPKLLQFFIEQLANPQIF